MKNNMKVSESKPYILFSNNGNFYYFTREEAEEGQKIHGGYISFRKLFSDQKIYRGYKTSRRGL